MWVRVDDGFPEHPKVLRAAERLGRNGIGRVISVWLEALCYANRYLTDGFISELVAKKIRSDRKPVEVLHRMCHKDVRLMARVEGGWRIHDYHDYQPSKKEIREKRRKDRDRKRAVRVESGTSPNGIAAIPGAAAQRVQLPRPLPSRPLPEEEDPDQDQREDAHRVLVRLAHQALNSHPGEAKEELKGLAAKARIHYDAGDIQRALDSAEVQKSLAPKGGRM